MTRITYLKAQDRPDRASRGVMVTDPHDGRPRPFCASIGKLFALAVSTKRYLAPTPDEDALWRTQGSRLIAQQQAIGFGKHAG